MAIAANWPGRSSGNWGPQPFGEALEARRFEVRIDCGFPGYNFRRNTPDAAATSAAAARLTALFLPAVGILIRIWRELWEATVGIKLVGYDPHWIRP
jgi:hypothetical protein